jgi:von Willebrand factor type A domain
MSTVRQDRGMCCSFLRRPIVAFAIAMLSSPVLAAESTLPSAELNTYQRDDGPTFFALSLTPAADLADASGNRDVVILFDTSASQSGIYRETALAAVEACIQKLRPQDRVQLLAVDLEARPVTADFLPADSKELRAALQALRQESPLGSTDMEQVLRATIARFDDAGPAGRNVFYIGDGMSTANLLGTDSFRQLVEDLSSARVSVSSYAIGPRRDGRLLAALANHTGGNLYVDEAMVWADDAHNVSENRAREENLRRGAGIGAILADWTRAAVLWPIEVTWPAELGEVYPKMVPPLRTDRDTVVVGAADKPLNKPVDIRVRVLGNAEPADLEWTAAPHTMGASHAFLAQVVDMAQADGGATLPTVGSAGLAETGRVLEAGIDSLTELAERAIGTGDIQTAEVAAKAVLSRDPGNVKAKTIQRAAAKPPVKAKQIAQTLPAVAQDDDELSLVRQPRTLPEPPATSERPADVAFPAPGSLTDRFAPEGELLDELEQQRRVFGQMLRREIENLVIDARRVMSSDPETAIQELKLALQNVERAPELTPDMRAQLLDKLQIALREAQRAAVIKDELDAAREEQLAAARERRLLNERLLREQERERQLVDRFNALVDEQRFNEALDVAATIAEVDPEGVTPVVAYVEAELNRNNYLQQVVRAARWQSYFDALYQIELSHVPFPDDPPIVYPAAPVWEELTNRRKDRYGSMDLKATGEAERRIESALRGPLRPTGLDFIDTPLEEVVRLLQEDYGIPVNLDTPALDEIGVGPEEPVTIQLHNISLRSALRLMLKQLQLTYIVQDEVLMITTPEEAEAQLVVKVYPVADLVLPIDAALLGGQQGGGGGGMGGGMGGGGMGGGGMGGGGMGGGGMGGGGMGGGGGMFSVPDDLQPVKPTADAQKDATLEVEVTKPTASVKRPGAKKVTAIAIDPSQNADAFWSDYFTRQQADPAAVRETIRQLMGEKKLDHVTALIHAALRHGQPQSWMYESLGIAMELNGSAKSDIERAVMSAADFSSSADELMYIAQYLSRLGLDRRAMLVYQQVVKLEPLRSEAYALGLRAAQRCEDLAGIQWATVGILGQAWPAEFKEIEHTASRVARATLERLASEGRDAQRDTYLQQLQEAVVRDCLVRVSWTGDADIDVAVEEPAGTICSLAEPRTTSGGVSMGDEFAVSGQPSGESSEVYVCPKGFAGRYRVLIRSIWGEVTAGKVTVDVYTHLRSGEMQHERQQLELADNQAMVVFDLNHGRRNEPLETAQLAGAVKRQEAISRAVLAQQLGSGADPSVAPNRPVDDFARRAAFLGRGGAVGFQPIVTTLPTGTTMSLLGVVSADRRYVRVAVQPVFSDIPRVQTFTFAGQAEEVEEDEDDDMAPPVPQF